MDKTKLCNILEISRWVGFGIGIFFAELPGQDPAQAFSIFSIWTVLSIAGLTGLESVFLGEASSRLSGYGKGGAYQRQSGFNNLALALAMLLAYSLGWGIYAKVALLTTLLIFLTLSACNHAYSALKENNKKLKNFLRPIMTIFLLTYSIPIILRTLAFIVK